MHLHLGLDVRVNAEEAPGAGPRPGRADNAVAEDHVEHALNTEEDVALHTEFVINLDEHAL